MSKEYLGNSIYTAQEHNLFGSSIGEKKYREKPYTPLAIIDGRVSVEECNNRRLKIKSLGGALLEYWGGGGYSATMSLEPLVLDKNSSSYGQTVRDPVLVDLDKDGSVRDLRDEFPYKRGELRVELKDGS